MEEPLPDDDQGAASNGTGQDDDHANEKPYQKFDQRSSDWYLEDKLARRDADRRFAELTTAAEGEACPEIDLRDVDCDSDKGEPMICLRTDGVGLFYAGHSNALIALTGAGKTWLQIYTALEAIERGWDAHMIDFEDDARRFKLRVSQIARGHNLDLDDILKRLHTGGPPVG